MRHVSKLLIAMTVAALASGCHSRSHHSRHLAVDEPVSIEIEVYDPKTNRVWENVDVRIIEVEHEWSGCLCKNPKQNDFYATDKEGIVYFSAERLGTSDLGFLEDDHHRAVLSPDYLEDEATVLVEISAPGMGAVYERIELDWDHSRVFISIPF